jgi:hypothetical protein
MGLLSVKVNFVYESTKTIKNLSFTWNLILAYDLAHLVGIPDYLSAYQMTVSIVDQKQMFLFISE